MPSQDPFVLLDDARDSGASDALLFESPSAVFVATRPKEVARVLAEADAARLERGGTLAGYIAYEAGLALEPKLLPLAEKRAGAAGPLVWFGLFDEAKRMAAEDVSAWLAERGGGGRAAIGPLDPQISAGAYLAAFEALQQAIRAGEIYQANLTFPLAGPANGHPLAIYAAIRPEAQAGYGGLVFDGSHWLLSFSPELFFACTGRAAQVKPMKGTRPRGATEDEDRALAADLAGSAKDKAENRMIVDLMRNDLSRVAEAGSVRVENPFAIESYPTVHQMVSTVRATLREGMGAMDMIAALFPCGSVTGAPKIRAMELIDAIERDARGPYCGAIGRIDGNGDAAFNVGIRTIRLTPGENERHQAVLGVGGAIVADSDGMAEWRECLIKGGFVRGQAEACDLIETMRFGGAVALLDFHLDRMEASAAALAFTFERERVRQQIEAVCARLEGAAKVRLLLSRSGAIALETAPLPPTPEEPIPCIALPLPVVAGDWRLRHKTTDRHFYADACAVAKDHGAVEAIFVRDDGLVTEGSFTSLFVERDGTLLTPPAALGLLPGVLRRSLIEQGRAEEAELSLDDLAGGFLLGNALRGLIQAKLI